MLCFIVRELPAGIIGYVQFDCLQTTLFSPLPLQRHLFFSATFLRLVLRLSVLSVVFSSIFAWSRLPSLLTLHFVALLSWRLRCFSTYTQTYKRSSVRMYGSCVLLCPPRSFCPVPPLLPPFLNAYPAHRLYITISQLSLYHSARPCYVIIFIFIPHLSCVLSMPFKQLIC